MSVSQRSHAHPLRSTCQGVVRNRPPVSQGVRDALIAEAIGLLCEIEGLNAVDQMGDVVRKALPGAQRLRRALVVTGVKLPPALGGEA